MFGFRNESFQINHSNTFGKDIGTWSAPKSFRYKNILKLIVRDIDFYFCFEHTECFIDWSKLWQWETKSLWIEICETQDMSCCGRCFAWSAQISSCFVGWRKYRRKWGKIEWKYLTSHFQFLHPFFFLFFFFRWISR